MEFIEVGKTGRAHGLKGEIKLRIEDWYEDDVLESDSLLIGEPPIPYFVEQYRGGGSLLVKLEGIDSREAVNLLSNQLVWLPEDRITAERVTELTPWDFLKGAFIESEGYPSLGPVLSIVDMPNHYLAEIEHAGKEILIPIHEDLIVEYNKNRQVLSMSLPEGLLDL